MIVDITGYYLMTEYGGDPAYGSLTQITGAGINPTYSNSLSEHVPDMSGGGLRVAVRGLLGDSWFAGAQYTGFFTDEGSSLGSIAANNDNVHANLLDRSLANIILNSNFDDGKADFASEDMSLKQNFGDLVLGKGLKSNGLLGGFWHAGVRVANTDLDRNVVYANQQGAGVDTAQIAFGSQMWGVGPTLGGGLSAILMPGVALTGTASASALYADFDLSRRDEYINQSNATGIREVSLGAREVVPVFDAALELAMQLGPVRASLGYAVSAWLGGARAINVAGWDDVDGATAPYTVKSDDLITHGVYARAAVDFGAFE